MQAVLTTVVWLGGIKKEKDGSALSYANCFLINKWIGNSVGSEMRYILMGIRNDTIKFCQVSHVVNIHT